MKRAFLAALLASALSQPVCAGDIWALKGVNTISWWLLWERAFGDPNNKQDKRCTVDDKTWNTNTEFLTNQTTKLHFIQVADHYHEVDRLWAAVPKFNFDKPDDPAYKEAYHKAEVYAYMPTLLVTIQTAVVDGGCVARVEAKVDEALGPAQARVNGYGVPTPRLEVWSSTTWVKGPYERFNQQVLAVSDRLIKEFVNEWTKAQAPPF
jgi:hypothetical protein